jgi:adenylate kinase family enzyme
VATELDTAQLAQRLRHVLWVAGSPCAGKSTISHTLARVYVFVGYHLDAMARNHFTRRIASGDVDAQAFLQKSMDERWIQPSVEELAQETIASWTADFRLTLEDLLALPSETFLFAEGNFFPACVAPYLSDPHQAIWLVPTDDFCEQARRQKQAALAERQRRHDMYDEGSDPEQRLRKLIARDRLLARYVSEQAQELGLMVIEVDGSRSAEAMTELVERHFDPYLIEGFRRFQRF